MEEKKQVGGKRRGAGRKPVLSKKKQYSFYIENSQTLKFGSEEKFKKAVIDFIYGFGIEPNYENPISELNKLPQYYVHDIQPQVEVKSAITGLPPKLSDFDKFSEELYGAKSRHDVEAIMKRSVGGIMFPKERIELKAIADKVMEDMFND